MNIQEHRELLNNYNSEVSEVIFGEVPIQKGSHPNLITQEPGQIEINLFAWDYWTKDIAKDLNLAKLENCRTIQSRIMYFV